MSEAVAAPKPPPWNEFVRSHLTPLVVLIEYLDYPAYDEEEGAGNAIAVLAMRVKHQIEDEGGDCPGWDDFQSQEVMGLCSAMAMAAIWATNGEAETTEGPGSQEAVEALYVLVGIARRLFLEKEVAHA